MFRFGNNKSQHVASVDNDGAEQTSITTLAHDPVSHLEVYLAYYVSRQRPGYAVLVTGDWGTGKTHQVRRVLPDSHAHYVSLFGLNKTEDIEAQVFAKMFPTKASLTRLAEKIDAVNIQVPVVGSLGSGGLASALATSFIKNEIDNTRPLIFDDLERCSIENRALLGLINRYVEQHKCRVIVIAHDDKVVKEFEESKEKIFGQSILVEPNIDAAFAEFRSYFAKVGAEDRFGDIANEVLATFKESQTASLRVLRHVVEDVVRLTAALEDRHIENRVAMVELVRLFSALAIETRCNRLGRDNLKNRKEAVSGYRLNAAKNNGEQPEPPSFLAAESRYKSIDLSSPLLNDTVLIEMLIEGRFDPTHIRDSLNSSHYFLEKEDAAPWQIVGSFDKLDDADVDRALKRMEEQFEKREVTESGEFLHIVSLKMMMASKGLTKENVQEVAAAAKAYLDDLLKDGRLPPRPAGWMWYDSLDGSYAGVGYWITDDYKGEFNEVCEHLVEARSAAMEKKFPELIPALLEVVREDGQKFFEKVCYTHNGVIEYEDIPILAHIPAKDFVEAWLASPKTGWYWIGNALKKRNKATAEYPNLKPESGWYTEVAKEMLNQEKKMTGLARLRIIRAVELMGLPPLAAQEARPGAPRSAAEAVPED